MKAIRRNSFEMRNLVRHELAKPGTVFKDKKKHLQKKLCRMRITND